jgi:hypothetical protein
LEGAVNVACGWPMPLHISGLWIRIDTIRIKQLSSIQIRIHKGKFEDKNFKKINIKKLKILVVCTISFL